MALHYLARKLREAPRCCLMLLFGQHSFSFNRSPSSSSSSSSFSFRLHCFSQTFHRSPLLPSYLSTLRPFSAHYVTDAFDFDGGRLQVSDQGIPALPLLLEVINRAVRSPSEAGAMDALNESGIEANKNLVYSAIWALREEWKSSLLAFRWGEKWGCDDENACNLMIRVLANHREFYAAWCLIGKLHGSSKDTRKALLLMIDSYASANDPVKAFKTFHLIEKLKLAPDDEAFHALLTALCKYGNMEEAEEFMLVNQKLFPLKVESFNIILNGWCNISIDVFEAKRVWREMSKRCITPDSTSYTHMISCFAKIGNLFDSLRLFDEMKKRGHFPGLAVYNSLIYVLTRENCFAEALKILEKINEVGLKPDSATYNSMIHPLCKAKKMDDARDILNMMMEGNIKTTIETYHAFLEAADFEKSFEILKQMKKEGLALCEDTFLIMLGKLLKLRQPENGLKTWEEMKNNETLPTAEHYSVLVEGLLSCGWLDKAREFYLEMESNGFILDPKLVNLLSQLEKKKGHEANQKDTKRKKAVNHRRGSTSGRKFQKHQREKSMR